MKYTKDGFIALDVKQLLNWEGAEGCIVSDRITKEGWKVGYMYREFPMSNFPDSGWCFLKGDEDDEYMNNPDNHHIFALNTVCNYDPDIIEYLDAPYDTRLIRISDDKFDLDDGVTPIKMIKQKH